MTGRKRKISLVLGSGGARGHAHIGVIRALEERDLDVRYIAGTSMGAVIGGIYAAGELDAYFKWAKQLQKRDVIRLLDFSFSLTSIFKGERIIEVLKDLVGDCKIEDLDIGYTAVATALEEHREIWLNRGSLFTAMKASTAVPAVFSPVEIDGRLLVDGGLVNPVPIAPTLNDSSDLTVAINLDGISDRHHPTKVAAEKGKKSKNDDEGYRAAISNFVSNLMENDEQSDSGRDAIDLIMQSIDVMQGGIARLKLAAYSPDVVIEFPRNACSFFEFDRAEEMADLGYERACKVLDEQVA